MIPMFLIFDIFFCLLMGYRIYNLMVSLGIVVIQYCHLGVKKIACKTAPGLIESMFLMQVCVRPDLRSNQSTGATCICYDSRI